MSDTTKVVETVVQTILDADANPGLTERSKERIMRELIFVYGNDVVIASAREAAARQAAKKEGSNGQNN